MKHILEFDGLEDKDELATVLNASKMSCALGEFSQYLRTKYKHTSPEEWPNLEVIRDKFHEICGEYGIDPWSC